MFPILAGIAVAGSLIATSYLSTFNVDSKIKEDIVKTKDLQTAQKLSAINDNKKIRLSSLVQKTNLSLQQKEDLDNFQKAINQAVIKENINDPSCSDLAATNYITQTKCETIKNSSNNYAKVEKGILIIDDSKMVKIINAQTKFKKSTTTDSITKIENHNKLFLNKKAEEIAKKNNKYIKEAKTIAKTADLDTINKYAHSIKIDDTSTENINLNVKKLNQLANLARRKKQLQNNVSTDHTTTPTTITDKIPTFVRYSTPTTITDKIPTFVRYSTPTTSGTQSSTTSSLSTPEVVIHNDTNELKNEKDKMLQWF